MISLTPLNARVPTPRRVDVVLPQLMVQTEAAVQIVDVSVDVLHKVPWKVLPYARLGTRRLYLVRHLEVFAERLMALRIARGEPRHMESIHSLIASLTPMEPLV